MILIEGKKPIICIDPGHGGHDSGAVAPTGQKESDMVLNICKELMYQLELKGIDCFQTRNDDSAVSLSKRCEIANEKDALLFLSVHCNSVGFATAEGIETLYNNGSGRGKALANYIQQAMMKYSDGHKNRGMKAAPSASYNHSLYVLSQTKMPAALVECEFLSHPEQVKWLESDGGQRQIAYALSEAILSYLKSLPGGQSVEEEEEEVAVDELKDFLDDVSIDDTEEENQCMIKEEQNEPEFDFGFDYEEGIEEGDK